MIQVYFLIKDKENFKLELNKVMPLSTHMIISLAMIESTLIQSFCCKVRPTTKN